MSQKGWNSEPPRNPRRCGKRSRVQLDDVGNNEHGNAGGEQSGSQLDTAPDGNQFRLPPTSDSFGGDGSSSGEMSIQSAIDKAKAFTTRDGVAPYDRPFTCPTHSEPSWASSERGTHYVRTEFRLQTTTR